MSNSPMGLPSEPELCWYHAHAAAFIIDNSSVEEALDFLPAMKELKGVESGMRKIEKMGNSLPTRRNMWKDRVPRNKEKVDTDVWLTLPCVELKIVEEKYLNLREILFVG